MESTKTTAQELQERVLRLAARAAETSYRGQTMIDFTESRRRDDDLEELAS